MGAQGRWCNRLKEKVKVVKFIKGNVYLFLLKYSWFIICKFQVYSMTLQLYICVCMYFSSSDSLPLITQYGVFVPCGILMLLLSSFSCDRLCVTLWTAAHQTPLSMGFSRQGYWSALPCPSAGDLPDPGIEPGSSAVQAIGRADVYAYGWFMLLYDRNQHNFVKQLSSN